MLLIISPAKKLNAERAPLTDSYTLPDLMEQSSTLARKLKTLSASELRTLMGVSEKIAELNVGRYKHFSPPFTLDNATQALLLFAGDVYANINTATFTEEEFTYAQSHLRILSGLYGLLRPLDLIQPYRLEMGTKLPTSHGEDLYDFWGDRITETLNTALKESGSDLLINLASQEYRKAIRTNKLNGTCVTIQFKEHRNGTYKTIGLLAKRARGMMTDYLIRHRVESLQEIAGFTGGGYTMDNSMSSGDTLVFTRE